MPDANKALELDAKDADSYDTRAHIYEVMGQKDKAISDYRKALELDPSMEESKEGLKRLTAAP